MAISITHYGNQKAVFANQDDGIFSALPITFDESVLTLETYTLGSRKYVKAGSVVKQGETVKGITAEEYDITDGPVNGRVAIEGYVYVEELTTAAVTAMSLLPKIVPIPYGKIIFAMDGAHGLEVGIRASGTVWADTVETSNISVAAESKLSGRPTVSATISSVKKSEHDDSLLIITFDSPAGDGVASITKIASTAVVGASGKVIAGLPIEIEFKNGEVCK